MTLEIVSVVKKQSDLSLLVSLFRENILYIVYLYILSVKYIFLQVRFFNLLR